MEELGLKIENPKTSTFKKTSVPGLAIAQLETKGGLGLGTTFELQSGSLKIPKLNDKFLKYFEKKNLCEQFMFDLNALADSFKAKHYSKLSTRTQSSVSALFESFTTELQSTILAPDEEVDISVSRLVEAIQGEFGWEEQ